MGAVLDSLQLYFSKSSSFGVGLLRVQFLGLGLLCVQFLRLGLLAVQVFLLFGASSESRFSSCGCDAVLLITIHACSGQPVASVSRHPPWSHLSYKELVGCRGIRGTKRFFVWFGRRRGSSFFIFVEIRKISLRGYRGQSDRISVIL